MPETVFSKIIRGEIPCHKVYEDERVLAFLDVGPLSRGHTLVVPKEPAVTLDQLSDESAAAIGRILPRICRAVMKVTGAPAYNVLQNNGTSAHQAVMHVHFHIIPKFPAQDSWAESGNGLELGWRPGRLSPETGAKLAAELSRLIAGCGGFVWEGGGRGPERGTESCGCDVRPRGLKPAALSPRL
jgi:histidine triad (HIT) family protein